MREHMTTRHTPVLQVLYDGLRLCLPSFTYRAGTDNAETVVVVPVIRVVVVPVGHGTVRSIVVPATATFYAVRTRCGTGQSFLLGVYLKHSLLFLNIIFFFATTRTIFWFSEFFYKFKICFRQFFTTSLTKLVCMQNFLFLLFVFFFRYSHTFLPFPSYTTAQRTA